MVSIENQFVIACHTHKGKISRRLGHIDCDLSHKPDWELFLSMSTTKSDTLKPNLKVSTEKAEVKLFNMEKISPGTSPNRVLFVTEDADIATVRPDIGVVTFRGYVEGALR